MPQHATEGIIQRQNIKSGSHDTISMRLVFFAVGFSERNYHTMEY
jgi:hypothetical protein